MFVSHTYEEVRMEDVAAQAGVSRALMYRYFPTKRDFFAAIFKADSEQLLAASEFGTDVPIAEQIVAGLTPTSTISRRTSTTSLPPTGVPSLATQRFRPSSRTSSSPFATGCST